MDKSIPTIIEDVAETFAQLLDGLKDRVTEQQKQMQDSIDAIQDRGSDRESLGCIVRAVWLDHAKAIGITDPEQLKPWWCLDEVSKEAERRMGEAVSKYILNGEMY